MITEGSLFKTSSIMLTEYDICPATLDDVPGIIELQEPNLVERGGGLSVRQNADWFGRATTGGEPWVFYLSPAFVDHCLGTIDAVIVGLGAFVRRTSRARALNNK